MSKELYCKCFEELEEELGRDPTEEEVQSRVEDKYSEAYDRAKAARYD